ncbi:MAG TPA: DUF937 domain-containing protein [Acidobacteriota bacterium]|nr:DUF937 domain-containing protein [Acidobacteriota bacterium]
MGLLDSLFSAGGGQAVSELSRRFGISEDQARSAISALAPAIGGGIKRNASSQEGADTLMRELTSGRHQEYVDDPSRLSRDETVQEGNGILGQLFGSKDVSRQVAKRASGQTGLSEDLLKRMLPLVATMVMGSLSRQASASGIQNQQDAQGGLFGMLSSLLDSDRDGSVLDDIMGFASRFGKR